MHPTRALMLIAVFLLPQLLCAAPEKSAPLKVLLIGNSQCPLIIKHRLIENLAASSEGGPRIEITGCVKGGASLKKHWEAGTGPETARGMIARGGWDYVVMQEIYNAQEADMLPYARQFHALVAGTGARAVFFGTASIISDYPQGFDRLHHAHLAAGKELGTLIVDSSHAYFKYLGEKPSAERMESLFAEDKMHPGLWGSYIYACGIYSAITGRSPVGLAAPAEIPADAAKDLQQAAWSQYQETAQALKK
jgi:hypothetical protein